MPPKTKKGGGATFNYVPGLNDRPDDSYFPEKEVEKSEDDYLYDEFISGRKNATMCLHEYCARNKLKLEFREEAAEHRPGIMAGYGFRAIVNDLKYKQGVGTNKKEAKTDASRLAIRALFGIDDYQPVTDAVVLDDNRFLEVRDLQDVCEQRNLFYSKHVIDSKDGTFSCTVAVQGLDQIVQRASDYDEAVVLAHRTALEQLGVRTAQVVPDTQINEPQLPQTDIYLKPPRPHIAQLREHAAYVTLDLKLQQLPQACRQFEYQIAAFFLSKDNESVGDIVAIGTGTSSIAAENITKDGRTVLDSSCMTVARRALRRYLAQEMLNLFEGNLSIFTWSDTVHGKMELNPDHTLHLFISHPPDGDYKNSLSVPSSLTLEQQEQIRQGHHIPEFTDQATGALCCRNESGMLEPTLETADQQTVEQVISANEMRVMSQSDKLLSWNILGIQGSVLSIFTLPIYLESISLGYHPSNDHGHLSRAVCCRVYEDLGPNFPPPYKVHHPVLQFSPTAPPSNVCGTTPSTLSINWNICDENIELLVGETGRTHDMSPFKVSSKNVSRICKAGLHLKWFSDLSKQAGSQFRAKVQSLSPAEVKGMAKDYQLVKKQLIDHCVIYNIGKWIQAPAQLDMFTK